jgi:dolichol-phosphate mannosyltransferase
MASTAPPHLRSLLAADTPRVVVLLCTYNEAENLPELYLQLRKHLPHADILVVDDNSPDGTAACVQALPGFRRTIETITHNALPAREQEGARGNFAEDEPAVFLLKRPGKQGLGTATRAGLQWCMAQSYDFVINLDADLSHAPEYAPILLSACTDEQPACDVAVGSRYVAGGGMRGLPFHRRWISRLLNTYATRLLHLPVKDCSGSFRCYRVTALQRLDFARLTCPGYGFLEEILVALHRSGAKLIELPIEFHARSQGHSKLGLSDAWGAISVIHRLAMRS